MTQRNSLAGCSSGWVECLPSSSFPVPAVLVYSIFRPFVFPKTAICVFRVIGTGSRACFSLSHGFNQLCIPGPWTDVYTHTNSNTHRHIYTETHTHALKRRQVVLAVCGDTWRKWSVRKRDACHRFSARRATLQQHLITVPSARLCWDFPNTVCLSPKISCKHGPQEGNLLPLVWSYCRQ